MPASAFTTRPELLGTFGMVASTHWLASAAGMAVLEAGGNAYDAAVAAGFVLHVVEPHLNGVGGDMPAICHDARTGRTFVVCGQGTAPAAATPEVFTDEGLAEIPGTGLLAATVPGTFGAWMLMLERYGTMRLREVLGYAIGYARDGYPLVAQAVNTIAAVAPVFAEHWQTSAQIYTPAGRAPEPRSRFANPMLADTLDRLVAEGEAAGTTREAQIEGARRAFYAGFVAEAIHDFAATEQWDPTGTHRGLLTGADLDGWRASEEEPLVADFAGVQVAKTGPWGQGPVLLQQLRILETFDLASMSPGSADLVHTVVESAKLAFADREACYGDPDHVDVPTGELTSPSYAAERARLIGPMADGALRPGSPGGREPHLPRAVLAAMADGGAWPDGLATPPVPGQGEPTVARGDTCHLDVVDRWGNVVSATPSGGWLQSSPSIPDLGFALGTRAQMFWLEQGLASSLAPGRRPRTTLSPSMLLRDGRPYLAFGTPGGDQQDQWTVPFLINHLVFGMDLQAAIDAPTWHTTHGPSSFAPRVAEPFGVRAESRLGAGVLADLRRRGHQLTEADPWSLGRVSAAGIRPDGLLVAAANPRGMQGYAVGR
ncbi:gamma-glutamyltransferase family protein [Occultella glacieicola]|uniref:Gamma-glutamyltransferase family protein n=1 Tax=Occultella glacieicola TaxID=2518684 RepID=A0ABY2E5L8_9MICO|nr:gamma-glutamyltransferase family protein [Occultella glacieicola]TDE94791.1 gamma-glutamyltransferase family protein [Occultella glacieicola]